MSAKDIKRVPCAHPDCTEFWPARFWLEQRDFRQYHTDGWGYLYTDAGIRPVCPAHRILVDQPNDAL